MVAIPDGNQERFSGFADVYDANRPAPPRALGGWLVSYAGVAGPRVVDLGSGTGLSSRWAASWARSVVGVEPNADMRAVAESRTSPGVTFRAATSDDTGLARDAADVVLVVQAMHWMEPTATLAEVARILRPGGVLAVADADWPPVSGVAAAEAAWIALARRIRVFEARAARGTAGDDLRGPVRDDDPALADEDPRDPHRNRAMPGGVRSWPKSEHLDRMEASGHFAFVRELLFDEPVGGDADRFVALMRSQGSYRGLLRLGLTDGELGVADFERAVRDSFASSTVPPRLSFSWRVRIGVTPAR